MSWEPRAAGLGSPLAVKESVGREPAPWVCLRGSQEGDHAGAYPGKSRDTWICLNAAADLPGLWSMYITPVAVMQSVLVCMLCLMYIGTWHAPEGTLF